MVHVDNFLMCLSLEVGALIIGYFKLIYLCTLTIGYLIFYPFVLYAIGLEGSSEVWNFVVFTLVLLLLVFLIKINYDFIVGVHQANYKKMLLFNAFYLLNTILIVGTIGYAVVQLYLEGRTFTITKEAFGSVIVPTIFELYTFIVINSLYYKLKNTKSQLPRFIIHSTHEQIAKK